VTTFSDAVFEATQGLLNAQQQLTRDLLNASGGQTQADVDEKPTYGGGELDTDRAAADLGSDEYGEDQNEAASGVAAEGDVDETDNEADEADDEIDDEVGEEADELDEADDETDDEEVDELDDELDETDDEAEDEAEDEEVDELDESDDEPAPAVQAGGRPPGGRPRGGQRPARPAQAGRRTSGVAT
jgi:hypothetical protein